MYKQTNKALTETILQFNRSIQKISFSCDTKG
jgi:hypothetical protein